MQRSTDRFLTTHTGSLPRPDDLIRMMYAKEEGVPVDRAALWPRASGGGRRGGREAGRRRHRPRQRRRDVEAELRHLHQGPARPASAAPATPSSTRTSPTSRSWRSACSAIPAARAARRRPATRRSACATRRPPQADVDNLKAALASVKAAGGFMSAASPGVVSLFFRNEHYKDRELHLRHRRGDARTNTRRSPRPASCCRSTAPTSAWAGTSSTPT